MKSFKEYISEASFKIDMPDMPAVYVDAKSAGEVKKKLRTLLKKPMGVEVTRVNPAKVKKAFRLRAQGKDEDEEEVKEEAELDEATMSSSQIARLKKSYEPMRDKKISVSNANKLSAMMDKVGKDKEALIQLFKADIPFVSQSAVTKLITKHNMKGAEINKLREEVDLDERAKTPRQLINKDKEVMIVKKNKVIVIDKKDQDKYMKRGWSLAEALDKEDEPKVKEIIKKLKGASKAHAGQAQDLEKAVSEKRGRPRKDGTADGDLENIQMQLRKSVSLRGKKDVEFADGKKKKVDDKVARKVLQMIDKYRKPQDKQNIVNYIAKSEKNLMSFASGKAKDSDMDPDAKRRKILGLK